MASKTSRRRQRPVTRIERGPDQSGIVRHSDGCLEVHLNPQPIVAAAQQALKAARSPWALVAHTTDEDGMEWVLLRRNRVRSRP